MTGSKYLSLAAMLVAIGLTMAGCGVESTGAPVTDVKPVTDTLHGVEVVDNYRWLENNNSDVQAWTDRQNEYTRSHLDQLPDRQAIIERLQQLYDEADPEYSNFHTVIREHDLKVRKYLSLPNLK